MRYLIASDIHANWDALQAVLAAAAGAYDRVLSCGDLVGYGADPNRVVEWARAQVSVVVRGNHDKACASLEAMGWFNPTAQAAAQWTRGELTAANLEYLCGLPRGPVKAENFQLLHGSPLNEDDYVLGLHDADGLAEYLEPAVSFFGHTHMQGGFLWVRRSVRRIPPLEAGETRRVLALERDLVYLINPGSVGQPRDGDPRAAYALYDSGERLVTYCRVPYDVAAAQRKMRAAGLPERLALRLETGN
jgi:predicted phosphodiesterase